MFTACSTLALLALISPALAAITPTSPDSTTVVKEGGNLMALWNKDTTGTWTDVEIQLMTGPNEAMIPLQTLATGIDGTSNTSFTTPIPNVTPNSAIYFLQFTLGGDVSTSTWTTRFTIAAPDGSTTPPTNSSLFNGNTVQWGTGALVQASDANSTTSASTSTSTTAAAVTTTAVRSSTLSSTSSGITVYSSDVSTSTDSVSTSAFPTAAAAAASSKTQANASGAGRSAGLGLGGALLAGFVGTFMIVL